MKNENIVSFSDAVESLEKEIEKNRTGGDGPYDGVLNQRVEQMENRMSKVEQKIDSLNEKVSELIGKVSMLPGYPGLAVIMSIIGGALIVASKYLPT